MDTSLKLYYNDGQEDMTFPYNMEQAELFSFTVNKARMGGAPTISATLEYPVCLDDEWDAHCHFDDVYVVFNNERYYLKATPASSKSNDKLFYKHELQFVSERAVLESVYMIDDLENQTADIQPSNNTQFTFFGTAAEFAERINQSMYFSGVGDTCLYDTRTTPPTLIPIYLRVQNDDGYYVIVSGSPTTQALVTLSNNTIADALKQFYEVFGLPYFFDGKTIWIKESQDIVSAGYSINNVLGADVQPDGYGGLELIPYEYGQPNSILTVSRSNSTKQIYNRCSGTGSSDNIPYYYPNPTPSGTIHHEVEEMPGSTLTNAAVTVDDAVKFSNLNAGDSLQYTSTETAPTVAPQDARFYINNTQLIFVNSSLTSYMPVDMNTSPAAPLPVRIFPTTVVVKMEFTVPTSFELAYLPFFSIWDVCDAEYFLPTRLAFYGIDANTVSFYYQYESDDPGDFEEFQYEGTTLPQGRYAVAFEFVCYPDGVFVIGNLSNYTPVKFYVNRIRNAVNDWYFVHNDVSYYWSLESSGNEVSLADYGLSIAEGTTPVVGDKIIKVVDNWITPQDKLQPYCYRLSDGKKRFYPALNYPLTTLAYYTPDADLGDVVSGSTVTNDNYLDSGGSYYQFQNIYRRMHQKEHIEDFPDIRPSIEGMTNNGGRRIDMFDAFAYDLNDDNSGYYDENGTFNYNHPYFFARMRPTDTFNLFDQAIDESEMTISMTSGGCAPCEFTIMVDKNTGKNLVQTDGTTEDGLARDSDGDVRCGRKTSEVPQPSQNETRYTWTWIALKKNVDTYGHIMPFNDGTNTIRPRACTDRDTDDGDTFVILHIKMPDAYVVAAEQRLTQEVIKWMHENNSEKFNLSMKFSRAYLGENQSLVDILNENIKVSAKYNGITKTYFVSSYTYNMQPTSPVPEVTIGGLVESVEELEMRSAKSFAERISENIVENFDTLMIGFNKPMTRIINQNNTQVENTIRGEMPTDYVRTDERLDAGTLILGASDKSVIKLPNGSNGKVLTVKDGAVGWNYNNLEGYSFNLSKDYLIGTQETRIFSLIIGTSAEHSSSVILNAIIEIECADTTPGIITAYVKSESDNIVLNGAKKRITQYGQICLSTLASIDIDDENNPSREKNFVFCVVADRDEAFYARKTISVSGYSYPIESTTIGYLELAKY